MEERIASVKKVLEIDDKKEQVKAIQKEMESSAFWGNREEGIKKSKLLGDLKKDIEEVEFVELLYS